MEEEIKTIQKEKTDMIEEGTDMKTMKWITAFDEVYKGCSEYKGNSHILDEGVKILYVEPARVQGLISCSKNLEEQAVLVLDARQLTTALKLFQKMKVQDGMLLMFKKDFPCVVCSSEAEMGVIIAPRIVEKD